MIDYVETHAVIARLNEAFEGNWSFEVIAQEKEGSEVIVLGKLTAEGVSKSQFGSNKISLSKAGEVISIGDDWKAAASDALKKSASLFGVGLHLYGAEKVNQPSTQPEQTGKGMSEKSKPKGGTTISKEQLAQIKELRTKLGWTPEQVQGKTKELFNTDKVETLNPTMATAFIAFLQNQGNGKGADY